MDRAASTGWGCLVLFAFFAPAGCGTNDASPSRDASLEARVPSDAGYGASTCGQCVAQECSVEHAACAAEPSCGAYLACVEACPIAVGGDVDPACASTCPATSGSAADDARTALSRCHAGVASAGCPSCAGAGADGGSADPILNQVCPLSSDPNACFQCEDERCCMTYQKCHDNPDCAAFRTCYLGCTDSACTQSCADAHDSGVRDFAPRIACVTARCGDPCGPLNACAECALRECRDAYVGCQESADCFLLGECFLACKNARACVDGCFAKFSAAKTAFLAQYSCTNARCLVECD